MACSGTLGDVHPYVAMGIGLVARGHQVTVATAAPYRAMVEREGLAFHSVRPNLAPSSFSVDVARRTHDRKSGTSYLLRTLVLPHVDEMYADLTDACGNADLLVVHPIMFAAPVVAEALKLRWVTVKQAPGSFVSPHDPPLLPPFPALHVLRHFGPRPNRIVFDFFRRATRKWMTPVDDLRARLGLPRAAKHPIFDGMLSSLGTIACFPRALGRPQPDWPVNTRLTGYAFYDGGASAPTPNPELQTFLDRGEPPVVVTLGSSVVIGSDSLIDETLEAVRRVGCRAVLLVGRHATNHQNGLSPSVFFADYAPHSQLLPRASAVIHHGGMGTLAQSMRAGAPMLIVPFVNDQADNAFRASRLGIARVVPPERYRADRVTRELRALFTRPEYAARARAIATDVAREDGVAGACDMLEACCARGD